MPITRKRAAAAAAAAVAPVVVLEEEDDKLSAAIDISSDSIAGSEPSSESEGEESEEEDDTSDEGFIDSDSQAGGGEGSGDESEEEAEAEAEAGAEQLGANRSEAACSKIAGLLRSGRTLEGIKLVECKAYLKKNDLSQIGDIATCIDRIMLHWRFKDENPEKIYPRSSFCINCKGDVCRGDAVLFKQKVYEKSGKRHAKCIGKRIVAGKVIKESYGKEKQQHTFTIQVFWSTGAGKLPPLHLLLVKGRNLYRMMTFRQPWPDEAERLKALEEKHNRGDAARRSHCLNRPKSARNTLKGKKTSGKGRHEARSGRSEHGYNFTEVDKGKKRRAQSSNFSQPNKRSKKEGCQFPSRGECTGDRRAKKNRAHLDKSICTGLSSSLCNGSREKNHSNLQKNCHVAPVNKGPVGNGKRKARSEGKNSIGGILAGIPHPFVERPQGPPPLREVGNFRLPHPVGSSVTLPHRPDALFNTTLGFQHQNATLAASRAPAYFRGYPLNQQRGTFPSHNMPETVYHPHPEAAYCVPHFTYPRERAGFR